MTHDYNNLELPARVRVYMKDALPHMAGQASYYEGNLVQISNEHFFFSDLLLKKGDNKGEYLVSPNGSSRKRVNLRHHDGRQNLVGLVHLVEETPASPEKHRSLAHTVQHR